MPDESLPDGWRLIELGEVCTLPERQVRPAEFSKYEYYVGLENIEANTGRIVEYRRVSDADLKSSKFPFDDSCILYGKLRPYLNKVAIPQTTGICSTDILPLCPISKIVLKEYLYYFLRTPFFVKVATEKSTGANLPRIAPGSLLGITIPLPPIETQRKIMGILEKADKVNQKREQANQLISKIIQSIFLKIFGNPASNPKGWAMKKLRDVCSKITDGTHVTPKYTANGIPFLSVKDVRDGYLDFSDTKFTSEEQYNELTRRVKPEFGDILYTKVGTVGIAALVDTRQQFSIFVSVALLKPDSRIVDSKFLWAMLNSQYVRVQADRRVKGIGVPDLHLVEIKDFDVLVPPLEMQRRFSIAVDKVDRLMTHQKQATEGINELFHSLMNKAFRGELVT